MTDQVIVVLSTCPDAATAQRLAETLVTERLATCVNRIEGVRSTYVWQDELQDDPEVLLVIKTTAGRVGELEARLKALHPYELPEWLILPVSGGNERYLEWVRQGVTDKDGR
ncbi:MAG TPA: divalent-cation tolerance protein CutA [Povalibacter sp.]|uniref:divalent-cation tolerance protein CutA n=1 Tax=Povalibacter sp. TaxID=1962978 RepID=UPI002C30CD32|nr:divalent-cation tolerance protein CutA [Povalibacter sp.]HMN45756.1 divalent-cation tolerance protein CutA [Povalibacter sp.]